MCSSSIWNSDVFSKFDAISIMFKIFVTHFGNLFSSKIIVNTVSQIGFSQLTILVWRRFAKFFSSSSVPSSPCCPQQFLRLNSISCCSIKTDKSFISKMVCFSFSIVLLNFYRFGNSDMTFRKTSSFHSHAHGNACSQQVPVTTSNQN